MPLTCQHCGEEAFDTEEQVCLACGIVSRDVELKTDCDAEFTFRSFDSNSKKSINALSFGTETLCHLCHLFNVSQEVKKISAALLNSIYSERRKTRRAFKSNEDVGVLSGCCLKYVQEKQEGSVSIRSLCSALQCNKKKIFKMLKVLKSYLINHPTAIEDHTNDFVSGENLIEKQIIHNDCSESLNSFITFLLSSFPEENKDELIQKTTSLMELAESCWLLSGRSRIGVATAAVYLCWKSMHPQDKLSLVYFCNQYSLSYVKARSRVPEIKDMLLKLGANIPSMTKNYVTEKNILFHLEYILKNSESLRNDLLTDEFTEDAMALKEYDTFRKCYLKQKEQVNTVSLYDDDMNASEVEISDTEISSYIRTDKQVNLIMNLRKATNQE